jgi:hypothetical protein
VDEFVSVTTVSGVASIVWIKSGLRKKVSFGCVSRWSAIMTILQVRVGGGPADRRRPLVID